MKTFTSSLSKNYLPTFLAHCVGKLKDHQA